MSILAWIDFDGDERDRARRILDLFSERETRDELGLGAVRDSIADHLFPGTSTIQTRLRYMLFVPWCFQAVGPQRDIRRALEIARDREIALIEALKRGGETDGIIGRDAGARLRRLPSETYWSGLRSWGVRRIGGGREDVLRAAVALGGEDQAVWSPGLPEQPDDLFEAAVFRLSREEADFLTDRIAAACSGSLLAFLALEKDSAVCSQIWEHPARAAFPKPMRRLVDHAERFSNLMLGAALLYNLMLAEARGRDDWSDSYRQKLTEWRDAFDGARIADWDLDAFWDETRHDNHGQTPALRRFVAAWRSEALDPAGLADRGSARTLVERRETTLKGAQSRFRNRAALDRWGGASGAARLSFRWPNARGHLRDLANAA